MAGAAKACRLSGHGSRDVGVSTDLECLHPGDVTGYWLHRGRRPRFVLNLVLSGLLGSLVLVVGLVLTQNDGRMATYAALLLVQATLQWWLQRPTA